MGICQACGTLGISEAVIELDQPTGAAVNLLELLMLAKQQSEELLILVKTYPQPSSKHREITCVAGVNRDGELRRIFPVPFRLLEGEARFKKWWWVRAVVHKAQNDHRPESHKIDVGTIEHLSEISTKNDWSERRRWYEPHIITNFEELEVRRQQSGQTLGILRPVEILGLDITPEKQADWSDEETEKMGRECLFDDTTVKNRVPLRKLPFAFHYRYRCPESEEVIRHRVTDWEVGALYWNCVRSHGSEWQKPFRQKLEEELPGKDLMFLMGTIHRFPDQWLIVGLIYPPKLKKQQQAHLSFD